MKRIEKVACFLLMLALLSACAKDPAQQWEEKSKKAVALFNQKKYEEAIQLNKEALAVAEKNFGQDDPKTASSIYNIAGIYYMQGDVAKAEPLFLRALEIKRRTLGDKHPEIAKLLNTIAGLYFKQKRLFDSEKTYREAINMMVALVGDKNPSLAPLYSNLGTIYSIYGKYDEAAALFSRAAGIMPEEKQFQNSIQQLKNSRKEIPNRIAEIQSLLTNHPDNWELHWRLGNLYKSGGDFAQAFTAYQNALSLKPGEPHILEDLAVTAALSRDFKNALLYFTQLFETQPQRGDIAYNVARVYAENNNPAMAVKWLQKARADNYGTPQMMMADASLAKIKDSKEFKAYLEDIKQKDDTK